MSDDLVADSYVLMTYSVSALTTLNLYMNRIKRKVKTQLSLVAMVLFLVACGQRGPLYLPEPEQEPVETDKTETNETEDDGEKTPGTGVDGVPV